MKLTVLIHLGTLFILSSCEQAPLRSYLPPRNTYIAPLNLDSTRHSKPTTGTLVIQVRSEDGHPRIVLKRAPLSNGRLKKGSSTLKTVIRFSQPIKYSAQSPFIRKPIVQFAKIKLNSLKSPRPLAEPILPKYPITSNAQNAGNYFTTGPIHTIPAPNLATGATVFNSKHPFNINTGHNQLSHYQVTEEPTNDQILQDQVSGQVKYFAPDPDPSLPVRQIRPSSDPYSMPSGVGRLQSNAEHQDVHLKPAHPPATSYGVPINPASIPYAVDGVPLSVFNPGYLVSQSKNLYELHKQQLSNPDAASISSSHGSRFVSNDGTIFQPTNTETIPTTPTSQSDYLVHSIPFTLSPQASQGTANYDSFPATSSTPYFSNLHGAQAGFIASNFFANQGTENQAQQQTLSVNDHYNDQQHLVPQHLAQTTLPQYLESQSIASNSNPYFVDISRHQDQNQATLDLANQLVQHQIADQGAHVQPAISAYLLRKQLGYTNAPNDNQQFSAI